jgi:hypothetical protein
MASTQKRHKAALLNILLACAARLLPLLLLALPAVIQAQFNFVTNNGTITIIKYTGSGGLVTIPSTINGLPVASIGDYAFLYCSSLTRVTIPNNVTSIGYEAFDDCTHLTNVTIPNNVTSIGDYAFAGCSSLTSVTIGTNVTSIGGYVFFYCSSLTRVTIPNNVTNIGTYAFFSCGSLTNVTIGNSVTSIGYGAFQYCTSLTAIMVDALNPVYSGVDGVLFNKNQTTLIEYPVGKAGTYTVPNSVTSIGDSAFYYCPSLTSITIGDSVTGIGTSAFYSCTSLTNVTMGNSVTSIGDTAFSCCSSLPRVAIPNSVTSIGDYAFVNCTSLTGVYFRGNAPSIGLYVFDDDNNAVVYYLPGTTGWGTTFGGLPTAIVPPMLTITTPTNGQRWSNGVFPVTGTASDVVQVSNVWFQVNSNGWHLATTANNWTNWTATASLSPGTNIVSAYAVDTSGNPSSVSNVSFDFVVTNQLQIRANGWGTISPNYSNAWLEIGLNYSMNATAGSGFVFTNWTICTNWIGGVTTNNATVQFTMASNLTLQVNFMDTNRPVVAITNLVARQRVSNAVFTVKGRASDNWQVSNVVCQLNSGAWNNAATANICTNWTAVMNLIPGTNTVATYAVDTTGNVSTTNSVSFQYVVTNQLQIRANGLGTVSLNYSNAWLETGRNYSITSAPAAGFVFTNWVISTNWIGGTIITKTNLQFMMASNLTLQVNFVDMSKPTLTFTSPTSGQHMTKALATVMGTAGDNWKVTGVWYQLNGEAWTPVTTINSYTNWTTTVTLVVGTNTVKAYATDLGGNYSATNSLKIVSSNTFKLQLAFTNSLPLKTNGLVFSLQLSTGLNGHIQVSTNLTSWTTLTNFVGTNSSLTFRDPAATNFNRRFYRAIIP